MEAMEAPALKGLKLPLRAVPEPPADAPEAPEAEEPEGPGCDPVWEVLRAHVPHWLGVLRGLARADMPKKPPASASRPSATRRGGSR